MTRAELVPSRPANHITESDLFRGYSGLIDGRSLDPVTAETVRRRLAAAADEDPAPRADGRADVAAAPDDTAPAVTR